MGRSKEADILAYVEAVIEARLILRLQVDAPTPDKIAALRLAKARVTAAEKQLNGSQLGAARRMLLERGAA